MTALLQVRHLRKVYDGHGRSVEAIGDLSFACAAGELVCIVGPSGAGKTTLLKCVAGLIAPTTGEVVLGEARVAGPPADMAVVFQEYGRSLFPWLTVWRNVALPLEQRGARGEQRGLVEAALAEVGLADVHAAYPWQLSGGMQQRVAIARALAYQPSVLLMDEPFASVDAQTRADLEDLVLRVREQYGITILFVTHDIDESVYLSDRIVVLTHAPTVVKEVLPVQLPSPRDQIATKELPEFTHLRAHVYRLIRREQIDVHPVQERRSIQP